MGSEHYCLRWNNHQSNLLGVFSQLLKDESLVDVTLACSEGASIRAHKVVLSACSSYFRSLFVDHPSRHPIVILKDVRFEDLRTIIDFMYKGEVNVEYCQLPALLKTAESLQVKGLAEMTTLSAAGIDTTPVPPPAERMEEGEPSCGSIPQPSSRITPPLSLSKRASSPPLSLSKRVSSPPLSLSTRVSSPRLAPARVSPPRLRTSPPRLHPSRVSPQRIIVSQRQSPPRIVIPPRSPPQRAPPPHMSPPRIPSPPPPPREPDRNESCGINMSMNNACSRSYSESPPRPPSAPEPLPGPSHMPPVQQVPLSLKKEIEWDRSTEETSHSPSDYRLHHDADAYDGRRGDEGDRHYSCMYCGASFHHQSKLTRHILSHSLETLKYRESVLGRPLQLGPLGPIPEPHYMSIPHDETPLDLEIGPIEAGNVVLCKFCGKSFPDVSSLIAHLPVHTGDRPFKCEFCGKAFKLRHHMKDHCRVHTGERPFRCALCGKTFSRSTILKAHEKTHYPKYVRKFLSPSPVDTEEETPHQ